MDYLDRSKLKRRTELIKTYFKVNKEFTTVTNKVTVVFPEKYLDKKLALIDNEVKVLSVFAIIDENNNYAVSCVPIILTLSPSNISNITIEEEIYKCLTFEEGSVFMPINNSIMLTDFIYNLFDLFYVQGKVPFFLNYEDLSNLLAKSSEYAGIGIGDNPLIYEMLTSIISRLPEDKKIYIRHVSNASNKNKIRPTYVGLNNPYYSFDNTGARLFGSYFSAGVNVSIVEPETKSSATTDILRT